MLTGTGTALITPFTPDGKIDFPALETLVSETVSAGPDFIVAMGTTAETATMTPQEQQDVLRCIINTNSGHLPLVLGAGCNDTAALVARIRNISPDEVSAVLSVAPYYNKPSQEGLYAHFAEIAKASPVPVILYNIPSRTGVNMLPGTILRLARDFGNIAGVKEASGSMEQAMRIIKERPEGFAVYSGDDALGVPMTLMGGQGVISVLANSHPAACSAMIKHALGGRIKEALEIHYRFLDYISLLFCEGNPTGVKAAMSLMGKCCPHVRLPLVKASEGLMSYLSQALDKL